MPTAAEQSLDWRPAPADELAALLLYYARDGFAGLRLAADIAAWWDANGRGLPDGALDDLVGAYPALARQSSARPWRPPRRRSGCRRASSATNDAGSGAASGWRWRWRTRTPAAARRSCTPRWGCSTRLLAPRGGLPAFARRQLLPPRSALASPGPRGGPRRPRSRDRAAPDSRALLPWCSSPSPGPEP